MNRGLEVGIREELDIPVFDFNSMIGHVAMALSLVKLY